MSYHGNHIVIAAIGLTFLDTILDYKFLFVFLNFVMPVKSKFFSRDKNVFCCIKGWCIRGFMKTQII